MRIILLSVRFAPTVDVALLYSKQPQGGRARPQWAWGVLHGGGWVGCPCWELQVGLPRHPVTCRAAWRRCHGGEEAQEADA